MGGQGSGYGRARQHQGHAQRGAALAPQLTAQVPRQPRRAAACWALQPGAGYPGPGRHAVNPLSHPVVPVAVSGPARRFGGRDGLTRTRARNSPADLRQRRQVHPPGSRGGCAWERDPLRAGRPPTTGARSGPPRRSAAAPWIQLEPLQAVRSGGVAARESGGRPPTRAPPRAPARMRSAPAAGARRPPGGARWGDSAGRPPTGSGLTGSASAGAGAVGSAMRPGGRSARLASVGSRRGCTIRAGRSPGTAPERRQDRRPGGAQRVRWPPGVPRTTRGRRGRLRRTRLRRWRQVEQIQLFAAGHGSPPADGAERRAAHQAPAVGAGSAGRGAHVVDGPVGSQGRAAGPGRSVTGTQSGALRSHRAKAQGRRPAIGPESRTSRAHAYCSHPPGRSSAYYRRLPVPVG